MSWGCLLLTLYCCLETLSLVLYISSHGLQFSKVCSLLVRLIFWFDTFWCTNLTIYYQLQCIIYMYLLAEWFTVKQTRTSGTKKWYLMLVYLTSYHSLTYLFIESCCLPLMYYHLILKLIVIAKIIGQCLSLAILWGIGALIIPIL